MGQKDMRRPLDRLADIALEGRASGEKRIEQDPRFADDDFERGMT
jgi:hypothetical protein